MNRVGPADDPDRYELQELRSSGGEGQLWRGSIDVDGAPIPVAVKIVHPNKLGEIDEWRQRWQRQAELLRSLDHPGLVKVREVFEGPDPHEPRAADPSTSTLYLVMNWVEGPSLDEWVTRHPDRDVLDCSKVLGKLAGAVDYLHSGSVTGVPVLHRDIKPSNVIIGSAGPVLVDFGFSRVLGGQPMTWAGTANYVAPEVVRSGEFSPASDRFAVGATAYFTLTGETPNVDNRPAMAAHLTEVAGAQGRDDIAEHVLAMMDDEPARRPTALIPWAQQLAAAAISDTNMSVGSTQPIPTPPIDRSNETGAVEPRRSRRGAVIAGVFALLLLLGGGLAFIATRGGTDSDAAGASAGSPADTTEASDETDTSSTIEATTTTTEAIPTTLPLAVIPDVTGLEPSQAASALEAEGLVPIVAEEEGTVPFGVVTSMSPDADEEVDPGTEVVLSVSRPPASLPDVVGQSRDDALELFESIGVSVSVTEVLQEGARNDAVLTQEPAGGTGYATAVNLSVGVQPDIVYLADLTPVDRSFYNYEEGQANVNGDVYTRSVLVDPNRERVGFAEFDLARDFVRLVGVVGVRDDVRSDGLYRVEIFADGTKVYETDLVLGQSPVMDVDVEGTLRVRLQVTQLSGQYANDQFVVFGDARLIGPPGAAAAITDD